MYAIKYNDKWYIAEKVKETMYNPSADKTNRVWSEAGSTAWVCYVGAEQRAIQLEDHPK